MKEKKTFRVFVSRHYIACEWFDIESTSPAKARRKAEATARKLHPDRRATAADNGWHGDEPIEVQKVGSYNGGTHEMEKVAEGVYAPKF